MATSDAQKRAVAKYQKEKTKLFQLRFYPTDADIYDHMREQPNRSGHIRRFTRKDMECS